LATESDAREVGPEGDDENSMAMGARNLSVTLTALSVLTSGAPAGDIHCREVAITTSTGYINMNMKV
jgi:hypothetical protein